MRIPTAVLDLVLPLACAACGQVTPAGLCASCAAHLPGLALADHARLELAPGVTAVGAYAYDGVVRDAVHTLKIAGHHAAATALGRLLWYELGLPPPRVAPWPVTWVPSTSANRRQRGVDIPRLLAGPGAVGLLRRVRDGPDQTTLDRRRRRRAPVGAFAARSRLHGRVVLVDDVRTTGATARSAAEALRDAGAQRVLVATFAVVA